MKALTSGSNCESNQWLKLEIQMWVYFAMYGTSGAVTSHPVVCYSIAPYSPWLAQQSNQHLTIKTVQSVYSSFFLLTPIDSCGVKQWAGGTSPAKMLNVIWRKWKQHMGGNVLLCAPWTFSIIVSVVKLVSCSSLLVVWLRGCHGKSMYCFFGKAASFSHTSIRLMNKLS